ncbi:AAA family ATPase [Metapseudomonas otitidis]|uniref:AAA family ATPase n=1 Tax=Metapseudomonas otitidis TaxID=319939 RepID=UPI0013F5C27E|nr:ATP-binding protein [Pseudomonas otitidis]
MKGIRLEKIIIENFKKIEKQTISVKPITAIVGGNASGKSSILQAAQLYTAICQASFKSVKRTRTVDVSKTLANEDIIYRPTATILDLRYKEPASQTKSFKLGCECTITTEDGTEKKSQLNICISRGKNANLALKHEGDLNLMPEIGNQKNPFSILTPGLSGIPIKEEWRTKGALDAAAMHGDANLYLRTLLDHLFTQDLDESNIDKWNNEVIDLDGLPEKSSWKLFSKLFDECYSGARLYITHNKSRDRYINIQVYYLDSYFTLDMASTGMLQVIQILAYACFYNPPLLLLDEPDAHLHADSQTRLHSALKALTQNTNTKILLATHSPQLIQLLQHDENSSVVWLSEGKEVKVTAGQQPAIPILMELGALNLGAEAFHPQNKIILLTEDKDTRLVKLFAAANTKEKVAVISYNGCSNLQGARQLSLILRNLRPDAKIVIHRDRDFRTDQEITFEKLLFETWLKTEEADSICEIFTPNNDIEHSFITTKHLEASLKKITTLRTIEKATTEALAINRDIITGKIRSARAVIKERLYDSQRMKNKKTLRKNAKIPDTPPSDKEFLPKDGRTPLSIHQCHGKSAFRSIISEIHKLTKGDSKAILEAVMSSSLHLQNNDWTDALRL